MLIPFVKMQAQGNDFVIIDNRKLALQADFSLMSADLCSLHFGIGADGMVLIENSSLALARMLIYNSDGSRAEMCGSALRCVTSLLFLEQGDGWLKIETDSGIKKGLVRSAGTQNMVWVNMGTAEFVEQDLELIGIRGDLVDVGNKHFVSYLESVEADPHLLYGSEIEHHPHFFKPVNVQFVKVIDDQNIILKIWEAACGATLACGTGATASVFCGLKKSLLKLPVKVQMPGGFVIIDVDASGYLLGGEVGTVFWGETEWKI